METVNIIPKEILSIIPKYDGDEKLLNLFISKCEYVIRAFHKADNVTQDLYVYHSITSRLVGRAAALLSDHQDLTSWQQLKTLLTQHFGDPRSEECIAIELEGLKIKHGESYIQFCSRIQSVKSSLFSKVNRLQDEGVKAAKMIIYNNTALNVFLYNLPEEMLRIVRLRQCTDLVSALSVVTEEVNFLAQYNVKNNKPKSTHHHQPSTPHFPKPPIGFNQIPYQNNFKFGIPHNTQAQSQNRVGFRPYLPSQSRPFQGYQSGFIPNVNQRNYSQGPMQQYHTPYQQHRAPFQQPRVPFQQHRTPFQNSGFKFGIPQQHQPNNNNQFKFGIPNQQMHRPQVDSDVSMRTAPVRQNMIMDEPGPSEEHYALSEPYPYNYDYSYYIDEPQIDYVESSPSLYHIISESSENVVDDSSGTPENFQIKASNDQVK